MRPFGCHVTILNTLDSLGKFEGKVDEGFLVGYSNYDGDAAFDGKEHDFDAKKPEFEVILSPSSSAQSRKQDDKTKKEANGKSLIEYFTGYRDLSTEFEDFSNNSSNEVNAAGLQDITYSNDENDVGVEADFNNLETSIIVSPIPTTRIHKDHLVSQIIGDLSSTTQTRSMTRVVKDQGGGIDYEEVFALVVRIEAIRLFLAYASFMGFMVYQMDVKSAFLYGTIEEEVYVCQPQRFKDPDHPDKVYKVVKILRKFGLTEGKSASTPINTEKPLLKDPDVKRIFRYLKGKPHLGLWYLKDSPFDLVAYSDSDYTGASLDIKSTAGGCQFLGCRLISWQCKKQTVVATSSTEAEYVAAVSCCAQVPRMQIDLLAVQEANSCCHFIHRG
nr:ribonuclease H-like domain, reverse transcriptase, RNA-dependent DNA polymerase [Tanacetum cinerariifolium]